MKTISDEAYMNSLHYWIDHVERSKESIPAGKMEYYDEFAARFEDWKRRNVENVTSPKREGDDVHTSFMEQLEMLKSIGFSGVDVFVRYHLWCMIGGKR